MGGVLTREGGAVLEGGEPDTAAGRHLDEGQSAQFMIHFVRYLRGKLVQQI